ncbi:helix-turn-helix domain-containing protein [Nocardioides sp. BYT-33-1]|uniref:helix-turn-helix domain-containing protein n=1 Tax=Nocardioides sp. BYT-33-1 TaxID=3416952 RepID=UPI003F52EBFC
MPDSQDGPRFLTLADVAEMLSTSSAQVYALVRRGELPAIKIGGRGQWRVERSRLEEYIAQQYRQTERYVAEHPFEDSETEAETPPRGL